MIIIKRLYYMIATMIILAFCGTVIFFPMVLIKGLDRANRFMDNIAVNHTYIDKL